MKNLQIDQTQAKKLYKNASPELKEIFISTFGKETFSGKITDRIKTMEDVWNELGLNEYDVLPYKNPKNKQQRSVNAFVKIQHISQALNEGWEADFTNRNQYKYYPYFENKASGWACYCAGYYGSCIAPGSFGSYFKSSELAVYAGTQFTNIYSDYLT